MEEGRPPEVLLESFLELLKHKLRRPPGLPKRVLTSAAKAAEHRRAKDKRRRETPCWWIANGKECFRGDRCALKRKDKLRARLVCLAQSGHESIIISSSCRVHSLFFSDE